VEFLTSLGAVIVVGFGGYLAYTGNMDVADIIGFILYLSLFYTPVSGVARLLEDFSHALAGAERVIEILDTPSGIVDVPGAVPLPKLEGEICFADVSFAYEPSAPVLKNISFTAKPGQMIALVGPTGVGKTTAIQLAARFYEPDEGKVLFDGHDLKEVTLDSIREQIAMVLQDTFLFTGTIEENIGYAKPEASRDEIIEAAKIARIHDSVIEMADGYETQVGERGVKLSGGQKQRIAIARAVLRKAPILILDEATASVDIETEAQIQQAINDLAGSRTIIAIAHRLSTIRKADLILVFENGEIVQRGTHDELMELEGLYKRLNASILNV
jgi:ABC-type multidrug transport system fused ATPase/permease subunit